MAEKKRKQVSIYMHLDDPAECNALALFALSGHKQSRLIAYALEHFLKSYNIDLATATPESISDFIKMYPYLKNISMPQIQAVPYAFNMMPPQSSASAPSADGPKKSAVSFPNGDGSNTSPSNSQSAAELRRGLGGFQYN